MCSWHTIIPTDAGPAHGLAEPRFLAFVRHVTAGILSTPIGMKNGARDTVTPRPDGHVQTVNNQFSTHVIGRRPAQRPLGMLVPDRAQIDVALTTGQVRDVRRPDGIEPALIEPWRFTRSGGVIADRSGTVVHTLNDRGLIPAMP